MKIIIITPWHSEIMGYSDNFLPKALANLGHEVHLITSNAQVYYNIPFYKQVYEPFLGPPIVECGIKQVDGYYLHRLPVKENPFGIYMEGLLDLVKNLKPSIVQTYEIDKNYTFELAVNRKKLGYKLFTANHLHASVFPNYDKRYSIREYREWIRHYRENLSYFYKINKNIEICYPISTDCADIAIKYFKVPPRKIRIDPLGTDTVLFCSAEDANVNVVSEREKLGFKAEDIICIYTGRFTEGKRPSILAKAINHLQNNGEVTFKALFIGLGEDEELNIINIQKGCVSHHFVPTKQLPIYYQISDIGVWPKQESTSQLDAMACGLPLILSNKVEVLERVEDNGLLYEENNHIDLANKLLSLKNKELRKQMGKIGRQRAIENFSWDIIAKRRIQDYQKVL